MKPHSKKTWLILLAIVSIICSRALFFLIDDPEGPNLLIVLVGAAVLFALFSAIYLSFTRKNTTNKTTA